MTEKTCHDCTKWVYREVQSDTGLMKNMVPYCPVQREMINLNNTVCSELPKQGFKKATGFNNGLYTDPNSSAFLTSSIAYRVTYDDGSVCIYGDCMGNTVLVSTDPHDPHFT